MGDAELEGDRRALKAQVERLRGEREEGDGGDEENRELGGLDVDPAGEAAALLGRDRPPDCPDPLPLPPLFIHLTPSDSGDVTVTSCPTASPGVLRS